MAAFIPLSGAALLSALAIGSSACATPVAEHPTAASHAAAPQIPPRQNWRDLVPSRPDLACELATRVARDQAIRQVVASLPTSDPLWMEMAEVDAENTRWLKPVLASQGWPGFRMVGQTGSQNAWLLVQHATADPEFMREALTQLQAAIARSDALPAHAAYLEDRLLMMEGRPQRYGTQIEAPGGVARLYQLEDPEGVDARRLAIGLEPLDVYLARFGVSRPGSPR